ncbi:uncharacterized protein LACBIDRAFT_154928, partial [Laccaria bicolor S238N-H82]
ISHIGLNTPDIDSLSAFYLAALSLLGYKEKMSFMDGKLKKETGPLHLAFTARTHNQVRAFHSAALKAGGTCNGPPGLRAQYFMTYYAAFVVDPEGRNIEAVCMKP